MKDIVIVGAGGFAREVAWLIEEINTKSLEWKILGFIDDNKENKGLKLNGYEVLGTTDDLKKFPSEIYTIIGIGNGKTRENIVRKLENRKFATLISPLIRISATNKIGEGSIICSNNILTVNISIGKHVIINLNCTVGHDAIIEDYVTVLPSVNISGQTRTKKYTTLGTGAKIIQGITIGEDVMIGAGTIVIRDIEDNVTAVGNPARIIKNR